ncbi:MAG TPA: PilX N-terminal domain-containing pilus assembly protein [Vicinamibacteria bacterium]|nr:PilX N-terminal domain-containing pilus assembly protein [Vicinamibacteria bacterium]
MHVQRVDAPRPRPVRGQSGFALILALLALMLLTFLGLTLAATSSTELQIATNYRWSQQALYNAQAGLEVAKYVLTQQGGTFTNILPAVRPGPWKFGQTGTAGGPPDPRTLTPARAGVRDYERMGCADRAGVGYGRVLTPPVGLPFGLPDNTPLQDISQFMGASVNGAFTIWVRRDAPVATSGANLGQFSDATSDQSLVVTAEGIAPYLTQTSAFARANQAKRILEVSYMLLIGQGTRCQGLAGQQGLSASGENFDPCSPLKTSGVAGAFGVGSLTDTRKE